MKRFVRFILVVAVLLTAAGCIRNPFGPKTEYYGRGYNARQYSVYVFINGQQISDDDGDWLHQPGEYTRVVPLAGTTKHHFLVYSYPDPTLFRQEFDAAVDNESGDANLNGQRLDWAWTFGSRFQQ